MVVQLKKTELIITSFFACFIFFIYAPLEMYLSNVNEFWFNIHTIWQVLMMSFVICFIGSSVVGIFLKGRLYKLYIALLLSFGICCYLQGGFINLNVGVMNGSNVQWGDFAMKIAINTAIWIAIPCIISAIVLRVNESIFDYISGISLSLSILLIMLLISSFISASKSKDLFSSDRVRFLSADHLYDVGGDGSIIVFILDAFDSSYMDNVLDDESLIHNLDGFTLFNNYTGLYPQTEYSMASLIGGNVFHNEMPRLEWVERNAENVLYEDEVISMGYDISIYTDMPEDVPQRIVSKCDNYVEANLSFYNFRTCFSLLYRLVGCKYLPDVVKPFIWMNGSEFEGSAVTDTSSKVYDSSNSVFRDNLRTEGISVLKGVKTYKLIHIFGAHEPFSIDENGEDVAENWDKNTDAAKGALRLVLEYTNQMKQLGVYDNSAIVITADHGWHGNDGIISTPVFMLKKAGERGNLKFSNAPVSHTDFAATIVGLAGSGNEANYGIPVWKVDEKAVRDRYYYQYTYDKESTIRDGNFCLVEYRTGKESNDTSLFTLTNVEYTWSGKKIDHNKYCSTCINNVEPSDYSGWEQLIHYHSDNYPE